jgi:hypothetical protein
MFGGNGCVPPTAPELVSNPLEGTGKPSILMASLADRRSYSLAHVQVPSAVPLSFINEERPRGKQAITLLAEKPGCTGVSIC